MAGIGQSKPGMTPDTMIDTDAIVKQIIANAGGGGKKGKRKGRRGKGKGGMYNQNLTRMFEMYAAMGRQAQQQARLARTPMSLVPLDQMDDWQKAQRGDGIGRLNRAMDDLEKRMRGFGLDPRGRRRDDDDEDDGEDGPARGGGRIRADEGANRPIDDAERLRRIHEAVDILSHGFGRRRQLPSFETSGVMSEVDSILSGYNTPHHMAISSGLASRMSSGPPSPIPPPSPPPPPPPDFPPVGMDTEDLEEEIPEEEFQRRHGIEIPEEDLEEAPRERLPGIVDPYRWQRFGVPFPKDDPLNKELFPEDPEFPRGDPRRPMQVPGISIGRPIEEVPEAAVQTTIEDDDDDTTDEDDLGEGDVSLEDLGGLLAPDPAPIDDSMQIPEEDVEEARPEKMGRGGIITPYRQERFGMKDPRPDYDTPDIEPDIEAHEEMHQQAMNHPHDNEERAREVLPNDFRENRQFVRERNRARRARQQPLKIRQKTLEGDSTEGTTDREAQSQKGSSRSRSYSSSSSTGPHDDPHVRGNLLALNQNVAGANEGKNPNSVSSMEDAKRKKGHQSEAIKNKLNIDKPKYQRIDEMVAESVDLRRQNVENSREILQNARNIYSSALQMDQLQTQMREQQRIIAHLERQNNPRRNAPLIAHHQAQVARVQEQRQITLASAPQAPPSLADIVPVVASPSSPFVNSTFIQPAPSSPSALERLRSRLPSAPSISSFSARIGPRQNQVAPSSPIVGEVRSRVTGQTPPSQQQVSSRQRTALGEDDGGETRRNLNQLMVREQVEVDYPAFFEDQPMGE